MSGFRPYQTANVGSGVKVCTTLAINESPAQITAAESSHGVQVKVEHQEADLVWTLNSAQSQRGRDSSRQFQSESVGQGC